LGGRVHPGDVIEIDIPNRALNVRLSDEELRARLDVGTLYVQQWALRKLTGGDLPENAPSHSAPLRHGGQHPVRGL